MSRKICLFVLVFLILFEVSDSATTLTSAGTTVVTDGSSSTVGAFTELISSLSSTSTPTTYLTDSATIVSTSKPSTEETISVTTTSHTNKTTRISQITTKSDMKTALTDEKQTDFVLEFEDGLSPSQIDKYRIYRSEASGNMTMHLHDKDAKKSFVLTLCVAGVNNNSVAVQVIDILYSNDGPADVISLSIDEKPIGGSYTEESYNGGANWNVFKSTGPVGGKVSLNDGNHTLSMSVSADQWGAEFDAMIVRAVNQSTVVDLFCGYELL